MKRRYVALFPTVILIALAALLGIRGKKPSERLAVSPAAQPDALVTARSEAPNRPVRADDPLPTDPVYPHPITPDHQRIFAENRLIGALNGAMDDKDTSTLRTLVAQYRAQYPEDAHMLQGGYAVILDCLEHPGAQSRAAAQHWADEHHGSTLLRFVYRHCF
jgi:hypothetical protein